MVGKSGVMEGPSANAKALAAELGINQEVLDASFEEALPTNLPLAALDNAPRTNWSRCDRHCRHGGPVRYIELVEDWQDLPDARPGQIATLIDAGAKVEAAWRILTVHHLDEVKANLRWWNLVALCQRCHLLIQRKVTMDHPWPWEHSDWFRPYAAAWYALKYRGEELNRLETLGRLEELLKLGRREESVERMPL